MDSTTADSYLSEQAKGKFQKGHKPKGNSSKSCQKGYLSKNRILPACRFDRANHRLEKGKVKKATLCNYCRWLKQQAARFPGSVEEKQFLNDLNSPRGKPRRTTFICSHCTIAGESVALCKDICFQLWHEHQITNQ
jgi:hypothetical protein